MCTARVELFCGGGFRQQYKTLEANREFRLATRSQGFTCCDKNKREDALVPVFPSTDKDDNCLRRVRSTKRRPIRERRWAAAALKRGRETPQDLAARTGRGRDSLAREPGEMLYTAPLLNFKQTGGRVFLCMLRAHRESPPQKVFADRKFLRRNSMKTRKISALLIALLAVTLVACGSKKASTPTEAFKSFYEAAKNKDVAGIKRLLSKDALSKMEERAKQQNQSLDDLLSTQSQKGIPPAMPETRNEKIDGDKATLEYKDTDASSGWRTVRFVKEDGEWKTMF